MRDITVRWPPDKHRSLYSGSDRLAPIAPSKPQMRIGLLDHLAGPCILRPYNRAEAITVEEAARRAGRSTRTLRSWCLSYDVGRRIAGRWAVSIVALEMYLDGNKEALTAYLAGDRSSPTVVAYFKRLGVPIPRPAFGVREQRLSEVNVERR